MTAPEYENALNEFIDSGETSFVVGFQGLGYISSAGLRAVRYLRFWNHQASVVDALANIG